MNGRFGPWQVGKPYRDDKMWACSLTNLGTGQVSATVHGGTKEVVEDAAHHLSACSKWVTDDMHRELKRIHTAIEKGEDPNLLTT